MYIYIYIYAYNNNNEYHNSEITNNNVGVIHKYINHKLIIIISIIYTHDGNRKYMHIYKYSL